MGRFSGESIESLRAVARQAIDAGEIAVIVDLKEEIRVRIQRRTDSGRKPKPEQLRFREELETGVITEPSRDVPPTKQLESVPEELERLRREVDLWRALYSSESEILARWGVTASLPTPILEAVLTMWAKVVSEQPDLVRTAERLAVDRQAFANAIAKKSVDKT